MVGVLSGSVSINGYEIKKGSFVHLFSSEKTGLIQIKTEAYDSIWKKKVRSKKFAQDLVALFRSEDICNRIIQRCGNFTVLVFIQRIPLPSNLQFAELYCPQAFEFSLFKNNKYKDFLWFLEDEISPLKFGEEEENLTTEVGVLIRNGRKFYLIVSNLFLRFSVSFSVVDIII